MAQYFSLSHPLTRSLTLSPTYSLTTLLTHSLTTHPPTILPPISTRTLIIPQPETHALTAPPLTNTNNRQAPEYHIGGLNDACGTPTGLGTNPELTPSQAGKFQCV